MSITIIAGINGAGKTSMANFLVGEMAFDIRRERMCDVYRELAEDIKVFYYVKISLLQLYNLFFYIIKMLLKTLYFSALM